MSAGASEHEAPEHSGVQGQIADRALKGGGEHHPLEPFGPEEALAEAAVTSASDLLVCLTPTNFAATESCERINCQLRGFEGHGHSIAGSRWDHSECVADATFVSVASAVRLQ